MWILPRAPGLQSRARATRQRCGTPCCESESGACSSARSVFATASTTPLCWSADGTRSPSTRSARSFDRLADVERRADRHPVVELDHVLRVHADAAVRCVRAQRADVSGAMDTGPTVEAHPTRLER